MTIYQILPRLYGNGHFSNFDTPFFEYVKALGVTHVWYTGIPRHSMGKDYVKGNAGSPYSVSDYYDVNPYMADVPSRRKTEFKELVKRTHDAGLKVITDFVPNHISPDYSDSKGGIPHFDYCDYDWTDTRKIDYHAPGTWDKMKDIVFYWAGKGVDGLRCDMVEMVPPEFFKWLIAEVKAKYPGFIFVAEVYTKERYYQYINEVGFDFLYDKSGLYDTVKSVVMQGRSTHEITSNWLSLQGIQSHMLNFLENHDEQRFASAWFAGNAEKVFAPMGVSCLFSNAPFMIYFGQELGADALEGHCGRTSIFNFVDIPVISRMKEFIENGTALPEKEMDLLMKYREMLSISRNPLFEEGATWDLCYCNSPLGGFDPDMHFVFVRFSVPEGDAQPEAKLVACNFSGKDASMRIRIPLEFPIVELRDALIPVEVEAYGCKIQDIL